MSESSAPMSLRVAEARLLNPLIRTFRLEAADGGPLPGWEPGSHIQVRVRLPDGRQAWRHYSLIDLSGQRAAVSNPAWVKPETNSTGPASGRGFAGVYSERPSRNRATH